MYQLACCLLFIGFLNPLFSLPVADPSVVSLQLPAPEEDARSGLEELERTEILRLLPEELGPGRGHGLGDADPSANISNSRGHLRKVLPGQDPNILLSHLLARTRKQHKQHGPPVECFWKYCV
ncbi:urotensin-2 [Sciurus carolinensis]|uniref:urotensin-2 n=1 Tax=Sciurus carolinensis TaxID=30640 RepID=UPI001FB2BFA9|nr:urotensin-2 [Sciurus carolinensis]